MASKPKTVVYNWLALVTKADKHRNRPDPAYEFSNGRTFESTDRGTTGVYRKD